MKTSTSAWTAAMVVMSMQGPFTTAEAAPAQQLQQREEAPERPKYYFPRHVKRAYPNTTSSKSNSLSSLLASLTDNDDTTNYFNPQPSTDNEPADDQTEAPSQLTTSTTGPARVPADTSSEGNGNGNGNGRANSTSTSTSSTSTTSDGGLLNLGSLLNPTSSDSTSSDDSTTTVVLLPSSTDATTTKPAGQSNSNDNATTVTLDEPVSSPTTTTTNGGGLLGSGGLIGSLLQPSQTITSTIQPTGSSETESATYVSEFTPQPVATGSGGVPVSEVSPTAPATTDAPVDNTTNTSTGPVLVGLSTIIDNNPSSAAPTTTSESGGLLDPLLSGLQPDSTTASSTILQGTGATGTAPVIVQPTISSAPNTTSTDTPGLLDPLLSPTPTSTDASISSVVSSISSQISTISSTAALSDVASTLSSQLSSIVATDPAASSTLSSAFSGILSSAASSLASSSAAATATLTGTGISTGSYTLSTSGASVVPLPVETTSTAPSNGTLTTSSEPTITPTAPLTTDLPLTTSSTSSMPIPSVSLPGNSTTPLVVPTVISETSPLSSSISSTSSESSVSSTSVSISTQPSTPATTAPASTSSSVPSTTSTTSQAPASIVPTGTDSATTMSVPSSIIFAPTTSTSATATLTSVPSGSTTSSTSTGMPSAMPRLVQPPGGMPDSPANTTLIQVGFNYGLNFPFVVSTDNSASQIFTYLPQGIAYALGISNDKVVMNALMPYDTTKSLNFITTLAQAYIPSDMVSQLQLDLHTQMSKAYSNPDDPVHTLMAMINPTIPILPGANMDQGYGTPSQNPAATATGAGGDGAPIGGDSGSSQAVNGTSVGIGLGAVAGAAVYAAAMVYVARRYRKKRASHKRASSVQATGDMTQRSPAALSGGMGGYFMSGANGRGGPSRQSSYGSGGRDSRQSNNSSNNRSVREQGISAPISHGNSLGWD